MAVANVTGASKGFGGALEESAAAVRAAHGTRVVAQPGDVGDAAHRRELVAAAGGLGGLDLLVNNAGVLGAAPLPRLEAQPLDGLRAALETNVVAVLGLVQESLPLLRASGAGTVIALSPEAAAVPAGIGTRPGPESVVPGFLHLLDRRPASGRYVAPELAGAVE
ncbi:SDR family NAD(P)-dependent oxidoreductase [Streptomyces exfoliatus]|uniref:SDR family NAD(P)-dependent oxidoreductase n=1 Tax=Streptomyces exfoliatus TaxID=1905 RepID=UPI000466E3CB|nr:SDR family NAD(P)-dependent oxidoreductase [Streptomyces exfoliatus]